MSREKQIEEMAKDLCECYNSDGTCYQDDKPCDFRCDELINAQYIYDKGYRKRSVGEWIDTGNFELDNIYSGWKCSLCGHIFCGHKTNYCSNCGARMRKEDEGK